MITMIIIIVTECFVLFPSFVIRPVYSCIFLHALDATMDRKNDIIIVRAIAHNWLPNQEMEQNAIHRIETQEKNSQLY
jgi:hypothetical protein